MTAWTRVAAIAVVGTVACSGGGPYPGSDGGPPIDAERDASVDDAAPDARRDAGPDAPTDASPDAVEPLIDPAIDGQLTINEFMAANALTLPALTGPGLDWIELYNPTDQAIALHGYALTDDLAQPLKSGIGAGVEIAARGHLLLWADGAPAAGPTHLGFHLSDDGGAIGLARPDGSPIDRVVYGAQSTDHAAAREPDGSDRWQIEWLASPAAANLDTGGHAMGLELVTAPPEAVPAAGDLSERLLGYDALPDLALTIAPADVASLLAMPLVTVPAHITFAGRSYGPVGVHLKGHNSFQPITGKPSLRIKIDEYVDSARLFGLKDLTLNNMDDDLSMMHERLAYLVARTAGVPASRATHARLAINGAPYGLYLNVETVKKKMIGRWFSDDSGPLYGLPDVDFVPGHVARFELETGTEDRHLIAGLAAALTLTSPEAAIAAAGSYADVPAFLRYWALASLVAQFDAWPYSVPGDDILLYADPTSQQLAIIPWGMDETFYSGQLDVVALTSSVFARRCKQAPTCFQAYADQLWELLAMTEVMGLEAERVRVRAQIAPYVAADTRKPYSDAQVAASQQALYWFIADRRRNLGGMLPPPSAGAQQRLRAIAPRAR